MSKRLLYILIGAVVIIALLFLAWFWFFRSPATTITTGTFGSAGNKTPSGTISKPKTNIPNNFGQNTTVGGVGAQNTAGTQTSPNYGGNSLVTYTPYGTSSQYQPAYTNGDIVWLDTVSNTRPGSGSQSGFTPLSINQLNNGSINGTANITTPGSNNGSKNNTLGLGGALIGAGVGALACTAGLLGGGVVAGAAPTAVGIGATAAASAVAVPVFAPATDATLQAQLGTSNLLAGSNTLKNNFLDCVTRGIARTVLEQITKSIVAWINSGFNGQPSFIKNPNQFFTNVADQAAGAYLKSSALSFLCSPFSLQVKIAVAKSYAKQNSNASCSLSKAINNIKSFTNGNFGAGGWPGMLQLSNNPANNAFGSYSIGFVGINSAANNAVTAKKNDQTLGNGFLSLTEGTGCTTGPMQLSGPNAGKPGPVTCTGTKTTTPGSVIAASLNKTLGTGQDSLNLAKNFDEIISALLTQLMTKALYGLSNLGNGSDSTTGGTDTAATAEAQQLLTTLQGAISLAQNYGTVEQGSISDIQNTQNRMQSLVNCWEGANFGGTLSDAQIAQTNANASSTALRRDALNGRVVLLNMEITRANAAIAEIQQLQTMTLSAANSADVSAVNNQFNSDIAQGLLITQSDITNAQQDRETLQAEMTNLNHDTTTQLAQCNAFGH